MARPIIKIEQEPVDRILEFVALAGVLVMLIYSAASYGALPERIPMHFNAAGEPDGFGGKKMIWLLPAIGLVSYLGMTLMNRYPHTFNYLVKITEENARYHYRTATRMINTLKAVIMALFAYIHYMTIQVALGKMTGLGPWFLPVFLVAVLGTVGYFLWKSSQKTGKNGR